MAIRKGPPRFAYNLKRKQRRKFRKDGQHAPRPAPAGVGTPAQRRRRT